MLSGEQGRPQRRGAGGSDDERARALSAPTDRQQQRQRRKADRASAVARNAQSVHGRTRRQNLLLIIALISAARWSARALSPQDDLNGLYEDGQIEQQAVILYVEQVVLQLLGCILLGRAVGIA